MSARDKARSFAFRALATVFGAQVGAAVGLTALEEVRRRKRRPYRFPTSEPEAITAGGDRVTIYTFGEDLYEDMLADIAAATTTVFFETYIWKADEVGERFKAELTEAAARGVDVYVIYDTFANLVVPRAFKQFDDRLQVLAFGLVNGRSPLSPRTYARDHRKLLVVDERIGFTGGMNVGDEYAGGGSRSARSGAKARRP